MRDKIRKLVVEAITDTDKLTEVVDKLCDLHNVSNWVSVEDKLPNVNRCVLVKGKGISIDLAWRLDSNSYNWCKYHGGENFRKDQYIEMWMYPKD